MNDKKDPKTSSFVCPSCRAKHDYNIYALAQLAQGHELIFFCDCGEKLLLKRRSVRRAS
jgi:DNA-directed RNA polymerase subunit RPC12/RpoP